MTRWRKLLLVFLILIICSQIPFAYRRYELSRLSRAINQLNSERKHIADDYVEYKGVIHVHSYLGGHSPGTLDQIVAAAKQNQLDFVVMTEHASTRINTAALTLKGVHDGVLFVNGNEVAAPSGERLLIFPGDETENSEVDSVAGEIGHAKQRSALAIVAYPNDFKGWANNYDGLEVYNLYTNAKQINSVRMLFDGLWSYNSYPELLFATFYSRPNEALKIWDDLMRTTGRHLVATAGNDAHANVGIGLNDSTGKRWIGFTADPYERSFSLVRMHVLLPKADSLNTQNLLQAIQQGHCSIGFDVFADGSGFRFTARQNNIEKIEGDELSIGGGPITLRVQLPLAGRVVFYRDGSEYRTLNPAQDAEVAITEMGVYRVEVYLPQLPGRVKDQPWIISNPIYVR